MASILRRLGPVVVTAVATASLIGGAAWATGHLPIDNGVIKACYHTRSGNVRLLTPSNPTCTGPEQAIDWNQQGVPGEDGADGESVVMSDEPAGANCAAGGVKLTAGSSVEYVCNGLNGAPGQKGDVGAPGTPGKDGFSPRVAVAASTTCATGGRTVSITDASGTQTFNICNGAVGSQGPAGPGFTGSYTSPNGVYSLSVSDSGILLGKTNRTEGLMMEPNVVRLLSGHTLILEGIQVTRIGGGIALIDGGRVQLGRCAGGRPVAFLGSAVSGNVVSGGAGVWPLNDGQVSTGSTSVFSC